MQEVRELLNETQRDSARTHAPRRARAPRSKDRAWCCPRRAPKGFKQDFAKWQELTRQVTLALDDVESTLSKRCRRRPRRIGSRPAAMNARLPSTSSRWTATSRRWRRGNDPDPFRVADSLVAHRAAGARACRDRLLFLSAAASCRCRHDSAACSSRCARWRSSPCSCSRAGRSSCCRPSTPVTSSCRCWSTRRAACAIADADGGIAHRAGATACSTRDPSGAVARSAGPKCSGSATVLAESSAEEPDRPMAGAPIWPERSLPSASASAAAVSPASSCCRTAATRDRARRTSAVARRRRRCSRSASGRPEGVPDREVVGITAGDPRLDQALVDLHVTTVAHGFGRDAVCAAAARQRSAGRIAPVVPAADGTPTTRRSPSRPIR